MNTKFKREGSIVGGTVVGGKKAAATIKSRDPDFYKRIGSIGGGKPTDKKKGWQSMDKAKHRELSSKGGKISRRGQVTYIDITGERDKSLLQKIKEFFT